MEKVFKETNFSSIIVLLKILLYVSEYNGDVYIKINYIEEIGDEFICKKGEKIFLKRKSILNLKDFLKFIIRRDNVDNLDIDIIFEGNILISLIIEEGEVLTLHGEKKIENFMDNYLKKYFFV